MGQSKQEIEKQELEKNVFMKFVECIDINVVRIQSCKPPEPDILCEHECGKLYFELTDNTSQNIQYSTHTKDDVIRNKANWFKPFPKEYKAKFKKKYETHSFSCELLIYFTIQPDLGLHFDSGLEDNIEWIRQNIQQSQFNKVWIYDFHQDRILDCINSEHLINE